MSLVDDDDALLLFDNLMALLTTYNGDSSVRDLIRYAHSPSMRPRKVNYDDPREWYLKESRHVKGGQLRDFCGCSLCGRHEMNGDYQSYLKHAYGYAHQSNLRERRKNDQRTNAIIDIVLRLQCIRKRQALFDVMEASCGGRAPPADIVKHIVSLSE